VLRPEVRKEQKLRTTKDTLICPLTQPLLFSPLARLRLFGAALKSKAKKGDILMLYNFNNRTFDGPFMAKGDADFAIIEEAWGGNFKHQIR
jgi:hypothetical protein